MIHEIERIDKAVRIFTANKLPTFYVQASIIDSFPKLIGIMKMKALINVVSQLTQLQYDFFAFA
jgi:hypothetical protein